MAQTPLRAGAFVMGGVLLGLWGFLAFVKVEALPSLDPAAWSFWGIVGMAIGGGVFAARATSPAIRIVVWVALGIAVGVLAAAALFSRVPESMAALVTASGAGLIASAVPGPDEAQWV